MNLRRLGHAAPLVALLLAACAAASTPTPVPAAPPPAPPAATPTAGAEQDTSYARRLIASAAAVDRFYPQVRTGGTAEYDVLMFFVAPSGRVKRHQLLHTMQGTSGAQIEQVLQAYGPGIGNVSVIKRKPGELGPTGVNIAWVDLSFEPSEPDEP